MYLSVQGIATSSLVGLMNHGGAPILLWRWRGGGNLRLRRRRIFRASRAAEERRGRLGDVPRSSGIQEVEKGSSGNCGSRRWSKRDSPDLETKKWLSGSLLGSRNVEGGRGERVVAWGSTGGPRELYTGAAPDAAERVATTAGRRGGGDSSGDPLWLRG